MGISFWIETIASVLTVLCVWLAAKNLIWNWPVSILASLIYAYVFWNSQLFSDMYLQFFFVASQFFGWISWNSRNYSKIGRLSNLYRLVWVMVAVVLSIFWGMYIQKLHPNQSYPWWDAGTTCFSIVAILLQARHKIENWYVWIAVNIVYIPLYLCKSLYLTAIVYGILLILAIKGLKIWKNSVLLQNEV